MMSNVVNKNSQLHCRTWFTILNCRSSAKVDAGWWGTDSKINQGIKCGRIKTTSQIINVGKEYHEKLVEILRNYKFSLIVSESTDKGCVKHFFIVASANDNDLVTDFFFCLIPLKNTKAQTLDIKVVTFFQWQWYTL